PWYSYAGAPIIVTATVYCPGTNCAAKLGYRASQPMSTCPVGLDAIACASSDVDNAIGPSQFVSATPSPFTTSTMTTSDAANANPKTFTATIPRSVVTTKGIDYFIRVTDSQGTARWPAGSFYHGYGLDIGPDGSMAGTYYRMDVLATSVIAHAPQPVAQYKRPLPLNFRANCPTNKTCSATIWYRTTPVPTSTGSTPPVDTTQVVLGEPGSSWSSISPAPSSTTTVTEGLNELSWDYPISGGYVDTRGVDYLIKVTDGDTRMYWPGAPYEAYTGIQETPLLTYHVHTITPPVIIHAPIPAQPRGESVTIDWNFICYATSTADCQTKAYYRPVSSSGDVLGGFSPVTTTASVVTTTADFVYSAHAELSPEQANQEGIQYYIWATDGKTNSYSPGSTYEGFAIPVDGQNLGNNVPYTVMLYGAQAKSDTNGT
ncbi:MAG: hypothetical protein LC723_06555, partial [Actinobacteria bacterium]|nr:hypothetical protein [Actinomycetota bacterium]